LSQNCTHAVSFRRQGATLVENALVYKNALQEARNRHNEQAVKELERIAPYPPPIPT